MKRLRPYLSDVAAAVGISTRIVPHQLRHTYATEMVRAGVSLPVLMTLLSVAAKKGTSLAVER